MGAPFLWEHEAWSTEHENLAARPRSLGAEFPLYHLQQILSSEKVKKNNFIFFPKSIDKQFQVQYTIITERERRKKMTEFETMKKALERVYDEIEVEEWDDGSALITVELSELSIFHWFKDGKLERIDNDIDYSAITY